MTEVKAPPRPEAQRPPAVPAPEAPQATMAGRATSAAVEPAIRGRADSRSALEVVARGVRAGESHVSVNVDAQLNSMITSTNVIDRATAYEFKVLQLQEQRNALQVQKEHARTASEEAALQKQLDETIHNIAIYQNKRAEMRVNGQPIPSQLEPAVSLAQSLAANEQEQKLALENPLRLIEDKMKQATGNEAQRKQFVEQFGNFLGDMSEEEKQLLLQGMEASMQQTANVQAEARKKAFRRKLLKRGGLAAAPLLLMMWIATKMEGGGASGGGMMGGH